MKKKKKKEKKKKVKFVAMAMMIEPDKFTNSSFKN
jgi:hypothetical protein